MNSTKELSPDQLIEKLTKIEEFRSSFTEYWLSMDFDAVISPAGCLPAIPHKMSSEIFCLNSQYMIYNILDYPAGVVPVRLVQHEDIKVAMSEDAKHNSSHRVEGGQPRDRMCEFMRVA